MISQSFEFLLWLTSAFSFGWAMRTAWLMATRPKLDGWYMALLAVTGIEVLACCITGGLALTLHLARASLP